jgi:UDP-N-acetylglucosamine 3-dehydrogenase
LRQVGVGVIGLGVMGSLFARLAVQLPDSKLIGVADVDAGRAAKQAEALGVPWYSDYQELLRQDGLEAVVIATPDALHLAPAIVSAQAGKHILLEKPLATSPSDGQQIVDACAAAGVTLMVAHVLRFDPHYGEAYRAVTNGKVGDVVHLSARRNTSTGDAERLGGRVSIVYYLGSHSIDVIQWVVGSPIVEVTSISVRKLMARFNTDDTMMSLLRFENGAIGMLENSWIRPNGAASRRIGSSLTIMGTLGAVYVETNTAGATVYQPNSAEPFAASYSFDRTVFGQIGGVYRDEFAHFVECLRTGNRPIVSPQQALSTVIVCDAIERSLREGRRIQIDQTNAYARP